MPECLRRCFRITSYLCYLDIIDWFHCLCGSYSTPAVSEKRIFVQLLYLEKHVAVKLV